MARTITADSKLPTPLPFFSQAVSCAGPILVSDTTPYDPLTGVLDGDSPCTRPAGSAEQLRDPGKFRVEPRPGRRHGFPSG